MSKFTKIVALASVVHSAAATGVQFAGVNIAGFDFGCPSTDGIYYENEVQAPLNTQYTNGVQNADGVGQMQHFYDTYGLNVFRLPVCWQYLVGGTLGGSLDETNAGIYDELVGGCLNTTAYCVIDIHNYARWENQTIGQSDGAVTNAQFASLWYNIAAKYKDEPKVIFGLMNEPHNLDIDEWATSLQWAVDSVRSAGATTQKILLPGTDYAALGSFEGQAGAALSTVHNLNDDTNFDNLIFDVHQYLDTDYAGKVSDCAHTGVDKIQDLGSWLQENNRQAFLTETGGGSTGSCEMDLCAELDNLNYWPNQYLGWIGWAAGSFATDYALSLTPTYSNGQWTDRDILVDCVAGKFSS